MAEVLFPPGKILHAKKEVARIIGLTRLRKGARVLDAACGIGRHSHEFARRGFEVTGVDASAAYIKAAREKVRPPPSRGRVGRGCQAEFHIRDLRDLSPFHSQFDLVLNLFTSFGYYRKAADNERALAEMASCLRPGGRLVMEIRCRESLENLAPKSWQALARGFLLEEHEWIEKGRRMRNTWTLLRGASERKAVFELRIYAADELAAMFRRAGLKRVRKAGSLAGAPWDPMKRTVLVGTR